MIPKLPNLSSVIVVRSQEWTCLRQETNHSASVLPIGSTAKIQRNSLILGKKSDHHLVKAYL